MILTVPLGRHAPKESAKDTRAVVNYNRSSADMPCLTLSCVPSPKRLLIPTWIAMKIKWRYRPGDLEVLFFARLSERPMVSVLVESSGTGMAVRASRRSVGI